MDRYVKSKNLHKWGMTWLQLNSASPTLLNCRIIRELLVLNGNGLEKKYFNFYNTLLSAIYSLSLCLLKIISLIILQGVKGLLPLN